jgi:IMP dehydrogenase
MESSNSNIDTTNTNNPNTKYPYKKIKIEEIPLGLTFDDVLLMPQYSDINSRKDVSLKTRFSRNVKLNTPLVSSPMDTVTEADMAIEMARNGGIGIIHRFQSIEDQAKMVEKVKRAEAHIILDPIRVNKSITIKKLKDLVRIHNINTFLITDNGDETDGIIRSPNTKRNRSKSCLKDTLAGIVTHRDLRFVKEEGELVSSIMTPRDKMFVWTTTSDSEFPSANTLKEVMIEKRIEKIPIVNQQNEIIGLVTLKDILRLYETDYLANLDMEGSLVVGAAVGAKDDYIERTKALIDAGVDVIVVDIANGHSQLCIDTVKILKETFKDIDIVAGSIASGEGALNLIKAGADGIRCGIGNGSICITRIVAGSGVPQLSALIDVAPVCKEYDIPLISDGGNRNSGNMCKALAAGADCIMLGRLVAGCEESPSKVIYRDGKLCKVYRGMAGYGANIAKAQRIGDSEPNNKTFTPEGVEGYIPYAGPLKDVLHQFASGIKSGMSYSGSRSIVEMQSKAKFIRMTSSGIKESGVHDINKI